MTSSDLLALFDTLNPDSVSSLTKAQQTFLPERVIKKSVRLTGPHT